MAGTIILTSRATSEESLLHLVGAIAEAESRVGLLFVGDGVYSLVEGSKSQVAMSRFGRSMELFGCLEDIQARGLYGRLVPAVNAVDYGQIVELMMRHFSKVVSYL